MTLAQAPTPSAVSARAADATLAQDVTAGRCTDGPPRSRRRGPMLDEAILAAATAELIDVGYAGLTIEGVAARARTGKASVYRRWPSKQHLVLDTLTSHFPAGGQCPGEDTSALPADITTRDAFVTIATRMADVLRGPGGRLVAALAGQCSRDPELARLMEEHLFQRRCDGALDLLRRGVGRGEVRPEAVTRLIAGVGPSMLMHSLLVVGAVPGPEWIAAVVDDVLMPAIRPAGR